MKTKIPHPYPSPSFRGGDFLSGKLRFSETFRNFAIKRAKG